MSRDEKNKMWWLDEEYEEKMVEEGEKIENGNTPYIERAESGWQDYDSIIKGGEKPRKLKQKIQITFISRIVKFYAITSSLLGVSLLLSGEYLWSVIVFASILIIYFLGR